MPSKICKSEPQIAQAVTLMIASRASWISDPEQFRNGCRAYRARSGLSWSLRSQREFVLIRITGLGNAVRRRARADFAPAWQQREPNAVVPDVELNIEASFRPRSRVDGRWHGGERLQPKVQPLREFLARKSKKMKSKSPFIYFLFLFRIEPFQSMARKKIKKIASPWSSHPELWTNVRNRCAFSAPTGFLIADHHSVEFCFRQENVGEQTRGWPTPVRHIDPHFALTRHDALPEVSATRPQANARNTSFERYVDPVNRALPRRSCFGLGGG